MYRVIFHVDEEDKLTMGINNILNLLKADGQYEIILLLNGPVPKAATSDERLSELLNNNVSVKVCKNSLNSLDITEEALMEGIEVVAAGVQELVHKQQEGYAYIKP